jgi:hypothetical protein
MAYPYDNDENDDYTYGLSERQMRERMNHAIHGDDDDDSMIDFGDLDDLEPDDDDE